MLQQDERPRSRRHSLDMQAQDMAELGYEVNVILKYFLYKALSNLPCITFGYGALAELAKFLCFQHCNVNYIVCIYDSYIFVICLKKRICVHVLHTKK